MNALRFAIQDLYDTGKVSFYTYYLFMLNYHTYTGDDTSPLYALLDTHANEVDPRSLVSLRRKLHAMTN